MKTNEMRLTFDAYLSLMNEIKEAENLSEKNKEWLLGYLGHLDAYIKAEEQKSKNQELLANALKEWHEVEPDINKIIEIIDTIKELTKNKKELEKREKRFDRFIEKIEPHIDIFFDKMIEIITILKERKEV